MAAPKYTGAGRKAKMKERSERLRHTINLEGFNLSIYLKMCSFNFHICTAFFCKIDIRLEDNNLIIDLDKLNCAHT